MTARPGRAPLFVIIVLAIAALLFLLSAGPAFADHAYSHRYVVYGRIIDANNEPVLGVSVSVTLPPAIAEGACELDPKTRSSTDGWGDYYYCFHVHSFSPTGPIVIQAEGERVEATLDTKLRKTVQDIQLPGVDPRKDSSVVPVFRTTYTVRGRVWQPQVGAVVEGIPVQGITLPDVTVSSVLAANVGRFQQSAVTNNYGDYDARFTTASPPSAGDLTVTAAAGSGSAPINPIFMVSNVDVLVPALNPFVEGLQATWPYIVAVAAVGVAFFAAVRYKPRASRKGDVAKIPGIGRSKAARLRAAGYSTIDQLAVADGKDLAEKASLSPKEAKRLVKKAKEFRETLQGAEDQGIED